MIYSQSFRIVVQGLVQVMFGFSFVKLCKVPHKSHWLLASGRINYNVSGKEQTLFLTHYENMKKLE